MHLSPVWVTWELQEPIGMRHGRGGREHPGQVTNHTNNMLCSFYEFVFRNEKRVKTRLAVKTFFIVISWFLAEEIKQLTNVPDRSSLLKYGGGFQASLCSVSRSVSSSQEDDSASRQPSFRRAEQVDDRCRATVKYFLWSRQKAICFISRWCRDFFLLWRRDTDSYRDEDERRLIVVGFIVISLSLSIEHYCKISKNQDW